MHSKDLSRRDFIELTVLGTAGVGLATVPGLTGCGPAMKTVYGACYHDCPDRCSWKVTVTDGKVTDFSASTSDPYTAGELCDKMTRFPDDVTYHPDRILKPLKRVGPKGSGQFEEVSWEEAIADVAERLNTIIANDGGESVLPYSFGGNQGELQSSAGSRFFAHIGASQLERTICGSTVVPGILAANGQTTGVLPRDIVHSRYIILWATNPVLSNQHLWRLIVQAREAGAKVVVIDPFKSATAELADQHVQPMPGTDTALALGMMHVILNEGLEDRDYIEKYTEGINELTVHVEKYDPTTVSEITGLPVDEITGLAREYATASPSLIRMLIGIEHHANGGNASRAIAMLPALTGAWRLHGGGLMNMAYELSIGLNWQELELPADLPKPTTRSINMIKLGKALLDTELDPPVNALIVFNSNPAVTTPNQNLVLKGLEREDLLTIVLEHFVTDTARYADYVFPATTALENWDVLTSWGTPYLNINEPAIDPIGESKTNTEFFRLLSRAMGFKDNYLYQDDLEVVKSIFNTDHPYMEGITFESLRDSGSARYNIPDPWIPHAQGNFKTASGKCEFYNAEMDPSLPDYTPVSYPAEYLANYPLHLLTAKSPKNFLNSSHANVKRLTQAEGAPWLDMHTDDATARGLQDGDKIRVYNDRGEVLVTARLSSKVARGVVCMPQGFWTSLVDGGSTANALTDDRLTDMGGGGAIHEARVQVAKA